MGPQLTGAIFLIAGLICSRFPPKAINPLYGYRTVASMKNQQTWDAANKYANRYIIRLGLMLIVVGLVLAVILQTGMFTDKTEAWIALSLFITSLIGATVLLFIATEKHLAKIIVN